MSEELLAQILSLFLYLPIRDLYSPSQPKDKTRGKKSHKRGRKNIPRRVSEADSVGKGYQGLMEG
jgi:hypothetical protein